MLSLAGARRFSMEITVCDTPEELAHCAAEDGAARIREALEERDRAVIALAAGSSQIGMLKNLVAAQEIDWGKVIAFPLDEYVGLSSRHPASFSRYLLERFVERLPSELRAFYHVDGTEEDPVKEAVRVSRLLQKETLDVSFIGIGENGHIAFNDPPADFDTEVPYLVVDLDQRCREQQIHEGWFEKLDEVPEEAISMSVQQIMSSKNLICSVPEARKAEAVQRALEGKVNAQVPASILQKHEECRFYLDKESSALLKG